MTFLNNQVKIESYKPKILVIDDEQDVRLLCIDILSDEGYDVDSACDGREGFNKINKNKYDLIICDIVMPHLDGIQLLRHIHEKKIETEVIIMTANACLDNAIDALKLGAYDYFMKPFQIEDLIKVVDRALEKQKLINEKLKLQLEVEKKKLEAAQKNQFISMVSHELRTPLTVVLNYLYALQNELLGPVNQRQQEVLDIMLGEANRLGQDINNLLFFSKYNLEKSTPMSVPLKPIELINEVTHRFAIELKRRNLELQLDLSYDGLLYGDKSLINMGLENLLSNAIKFSHDGGIIIIKCEKNSEKDVLEISVQDFGIGIPKESQKHIFDRFVQAKNISNKIFKGVGLGLNIVKNVVQLHQGTVELSSKIGIGSTFLMRFPLKK